MRIAIVNITSGGLSGGYRKYLQSILPGIKSDSRVDGVDLFLPAGVELKGVSSDGGHTWPASSHRSDLRKAKAKLNQMRPDVVFIPTARWLDCGDTPVVSMVRNMEPLVIPFSPRSPVEIAKNLARRYAAFRSCTRSSGVIAVSSFVQEFLETRWRIRSDRLAVVYHGVSRSERQLPSKSPQNFQIPSERPFLFTAGSIRPARGLEDVIKAVGRMVGQGIPISLAIAGAVDPGMHGYWQDLRQLANDLGCSDDVLWLGQLDAASMSWSYANCAAFVMTSRAEACPNTALEAMGHGCVCVSTDTAPMPEIFGSAAVYYCAGDSRSLSGALGVAMSSDANAISEMRNRALNRARYFSWDRTARATVDFLESRVRSGRSQR